MTEGEVRGIWEQCCKVTHQVAFRVPPEAREFFTCLLGLRQKNRRRIENILSRGKGRREDEKNVDREIYRET